MNTDTNITTNSNQTDQNNHPIALPNTVSPPHPVILPEPRVPIVIRQADQTDLSFVDELQKKHSQMVGWFPTKQLETNITRGQVLVADSGSLRVGYCISNDRYLKHDDLGIIYQLNVAPEKHRGLIGATLVKTVFERAAYGCKLFCCWCAQDLEANHFWESLGFVPIAFRTGSRRAGQKKEPRIHIFWQRRIREGDEGEGGTPYWFPSETTGGALRENRLVLPIPPGTHWSDAKPAVLPGMERLRETLPAGEDEQKCRVKKKRKKKVAPKRPNGGLWFAPPEPTTQEKKAAKAAARKAKPKMKNNPKYVAAARELRDRFLEEVESNPSLLMSSGKYDVRRQLTTGNVSLDINPALLEAA